MTDLIDPYANNEFPVLNREYVSGWLQLTQEMISSFGETTLDVDPMHMDPEWCEANSPHVKTISYGFLTISLLTYLAHDALSVNKDTMVANNNLPINYGFDRLRLPRAVCVGSRIRARFTALEKRSSGDGGMITKYNVIVEIEGDEVPALVCEWLAYWNASPQQPSA